MKSTSTRAGFGNPAAPGRLPKSVLSLVVPHEG
jgi:hypothetical protein